MQGCNSKVNIFIQSCLFVQNYAPKNSIGIVFNPEQKKPLAELKKL